MSTIGHVDRISSFQYLAKRPTQRPACLLEQRKHALLLKTHYKHISNQKGKKVKKIRRLKVSRSNQLVTSSETEPQIKLHAFVGTFIHCYAHLFMQFTHPFIHSCIILIYSCIHKLSKVRWLLFAATEKNTWSDKFVSNRNNKEESHLLSPLKKAVDTEPSHSTCGCWTSSSLRRSSKSHRLIPSRQNALWIERLRWEMLLIVERF